MSQPNQVRYFCCNNFFFCFLFLMAFFFFLFSSLLASEYFVRIFVHRLENGRWPCQFLRVGLFVDSLDVQYWKRLDFTDPEMQSKESVSATFWGFKQDSTKLRAFTFSPIQHSLESRESKPNISRGLGQIKAVFFEAVRIEGTFHNQSGPYEVPLNPSNSQDGVKFWQQPSVNKSPYSLPYIPPLS